MRMKNTMRTKMIDLRRKFGEVAEVEESTLDFDKGVKERMRCQIGGLGGGARNAMEKS